MCPLSIRSGSVIFEIYIITPVITPHIHPLLLWSPVVSILDDDTILSLVRT